MSTLEKIDFFHEKDYAQISKQCEFILMRGCRCAKISFRLPISIPHYTITTCQSGLNQNYLMCEKLTYFVAYQFHLKQETKRMLKLIPLKFCLLTPIYVNFKSTSQPNKQSKRYLFFFNSQLHVFSCSIWHTFGEGLERKRIQVL